MDLLAIGFAVIVTGLAQDRPVSIGVYRPSSLSEAERANLAFAKRRAHYLTGFGTYYGGPIRVVAAVAEEAGPVLRFKGAVDIRTDAYTLEADEVDLNRDSGVIQPRGNVRLTPVLTPLH